MMANVEMAIIIRRRISNYILHMCVMIKVFSNFNESDVDERGILKYIGIMLKRAINNSKYTYETYNINYETRR